MGGCEAQTLSPLARHVYCMLIALGTTASRNQLHSSGISVVEWTYTAHDLIWKCFVTKQWGIRKETSFFIKLSSLQGLHIFVFYIKILRLRSVDRV